MVTPFKNQVMAVKTDIRDQRLLEMIHLALVSMPDYARRLIDRNVSTITDDPRQFEGVVVGTLGLTIGGLPDGKFQIALLPGLIDVRGPGVALATIMHEFAHAALEHTRPGHIAQHGREALEAEAWRLATVWIEHSKRTVEAASRRQRFNDAIKHCQWPHEGRIKEWAGGRVMGQVFSGRL